MNDEYIKLKNIINNYQNNDFSVNIMAFQKLSQMDEKYFDEFKDYPFLNYKSVKNKSLICFLLNGETNIDFCQKILNNYKNLKANISYSDCLLDNKYFERNFNFLIKNNILKMEENQLNKDIILTLIKRKSFKFYNKLVEEGCYTKLFEQITSKDTKYFNIFLNTNNTNCKIYDYIKNCNFKTKFKLYIQLIESLKFINDIDMFKKIEDDLIKENKDAVFNVNYFGSIRSNIMYKNVMNNDVFKEYLCNNILNKYSDEDMKILKNMFNFKDENIQNIIEKRNIIKALEKENIVSNKHLTKRKM